MMDSSEWIGRVGDVWAEEWRRTDRSFVPIDNVLIERVAARLAGIDAPRILDVGCGAGTTSLSLVQRLSTASVSGIDLSGALIEVARGRALDLARVHFHRADASCWSKEAGFDTLVSRHGVMFFGNPVAAFAHLRGLAKPGAALVFSCFRSPAENVWASGLAYAMPGKATDSHAPGPFAFADEGRVADILLRAGWRGPSADSLDFDYVAGAGDDPVGDAVDYFRRIGPIARALRDLDGAARDRLHTELEAFVRKHRVGDRVSFPAAAWIWSATA